MSNYDISGGLNALETDIQDAQKREGAVRDEMRRNQRDMKDAAAELASLADFYGIDASGLAVSESEDLAQSELNLCYDELLRGVDKEIFHSVPRLPKLSTQDFVVAAAIGLVAALIDFFLVGIPHKGHSKETGSPLTDLLRKVGQTKGGKKNPIVSWLERKFEVPYDISCVKNVLYPKNHRLRSFAHDPFIGLFFAVFDCKFGTCTCIDNAGHIRITTDRNQPTMFPMILYLGHLVSDICTSSGLPVPGWVLTQFFANPDDKEMSIARAAEEMYRDGYDLRHFVSMSSSVGASKLLLSLYGRLQQSEPSELGVLHYQREMDALYHRLTEGKMLFVANTVASSGNLVKLIVPPSNGNPAAINLPQWTEMLRSSIQIARATLRDRTPELIVENRKKINEEWAKLLGTQ